MATNNGLYFKPVFSDTWSTDHNKQSMSALVHRRYQFHQLQLSILLIQATSLISGHWWAHFHDSFHPLSIYHSCLIHTAPHLQEWFDALFIVYINNHLFWKCDPSFWCFVDICLWFTRCISVSTMSSLLHHPDFSSLCSQAALEASGGLWCLHGCAVNIILHCMGQTLLTVSFF